MVEKQNQKVQLTLSQILGMLQNEREGLLALDQQLTDLQLALEDAFKAQTAIEALEKNPKEASALVPLGAGVFAHAQIKEPQAILTTLGGGVIKKSTLKEAKDALSNRENETRAEIERLSNQRQRVATNIQELSLVVRRVQEQANRKPQ